MVNVTDGKKITQKTVVALGLFDGMHRGHKQIIAEMLKYCDKGYASAVFTFNTESVRFKHGKPFEYISTNEQKLRTLEFIGIDYIMCPDFDDMKELTGEEFALEILCKQLNATAVACGENFRFGKNASCGTEELKKFGKKYGFEVIVTELVSDGFSSEKYRALLREGRVNDSYILGGAGYSLYAEVVAGNRLGRTLDFPTINQNFAEGQLVPKRGVYHTGTVINGVVYDSITNVGVKPTVEKDIKPLAETHILDYSGDLYGKKLEVLFYSFIRDEMKFGSVEELKKQVMADIDCVRREIAGVVCQKPEGKD